MCWLRKSYIFKKKKRKKKPLKASLDDTVQNSRGNNLLNSVHRSLSTCQVLQGWEEEGSGLQVMAPLWHRSSLPSPKTDLNLCASSIYFLLWSSSGPAHPDQMTQAFRVSIYKIQLKCMHPTRPYQCFLSWGALLSHLVPLHLDHHPQSLLTA